MGTHIRVIARALSLVGLGLVLTVPVTAEAQEPAPTSSADAAEVKDLPLTAEERQAYVGSYTVTNADGEEMPFRIFERDGFLHGEPHGQDPKRLLYQGDHRFRPEGILEFSVTFVLADGRATGFTARGRNQVLEGIRSQ